MTTTLRFLGSSNCSIAGLAVISVLAVFLTTIEPRSFFEEPAHLAVRRCRRSAALTVLIARPLWTGRRELLAARVVIGLYFLLLLPGVGAVSALRMLAIEGFPIAATARLPTVDQVERLFSLRSPASLDDRRAGRSDGPPGSRHRSKRREQASNN